MGIYIHIPRSNAGANDREKLRLERGDHREAIKYCRERSARTSWLSPGFFCSTIPKETFFQTEDRFKYPLIRYSSRPRKEWEIRRARMAPLKASERGWLEEVRRERREGREKKANPRRRRRVAPRDSFCLRSSSSRFSRGVIRRVITTTNVYIDINAIYSREISSFELSPITDEWSEREREDYYENLKKNRGK